jgi:hypothetical protein
MNDTLNEAIDQIIINLKTIGKLRINDKLYLYNGYINIQKDSIFRGVVRSIYGYDRNQSCIIIQEVIMKAIRASSTLCNIDNVSPTNPIYFLNYLKIMINLRNSFSLSKEGLNNFMHTYEDDQTIVSRIENIMIHLNNQISIIDSKLNHSQYKTAIEKYFPSNLEKIITTSTPPSYHKYHECVENEMLDLEQDEQ